FSRNGTSRDIVQTRRQHMCLAGCLGFDTVGDLGHLTAMCHPYQSSSRHSAAGVVNNLHIAAKFVLDAYVMNVFFAKQLLTDLDSIWTHPKTASRCCHLASWIEQQH